MTGSHTIADVAAAAGVSITTVSHALSGKRAVSEATRTRILDVVEELDYRPNVVAQGLRFHRTQTIAFLMVDIANPFYPAVARAINDVLSEAGYLQLIGNTDNDESAERALLRDVVARRVDGIIMSSMSLRSDDVRRIVGPDTPLVIIGGEVVDPGTDHVCADDAQGISEAVGYLVRKGSTPIGFVTGPAGRAPGPQRLAAFRVALEENAIVCDERWIESTPFTREGGFAAGIRLLSRADRPRAVMCANDLIAIGVIDAARRLDLRVPEDVAVVGFDDIETASLMSPSLTTIQNPASLLGHACANVLLRRLNGSRERHETIALPTTLMARQSA